MPPESSVSHLRNSERHPVHARAKLASPVGFYLRAECAKLAVKGQTGGQEEARRPDDIAKMGYKKRGL